MKRLVGLLATCLLLVGATVQAEDSVTNSDGSFDVAPILSLDD